MTTMANQRKIISHAAFCMKSDKHYIFFVLVFGPAGIIAIYVYAFALSPTCRGHTHMNKVVEV